MGQETGDPPVSQEPIGTQPDGVQEARADATATVLGVKPKALPTERHGRATSSARTRQLTS